MFDNVLEKALLKFYHVLVGCMISIVKLQAVFVLPLIIPPPPVMLSV